MFRYFKSLAAVLTGLIAPMILSRLTDVFLESNGVFPSEEYQKVHGFNVLWMNALALAYRALFTVLGGYLTFRLAPAKAMAHVLMLASAAMVITTAANIAVGLIPETSKVLPIWFSVVSVFLAFICTWLGGKAAAALTSR